MNILMADPQQLPQIPTGMLCKHVDTDGNLSKTTLYVCGFWFTKPHMINDNPVNWLITHPKGSVELFTDERGGLQMHAVFSDPNDLLLFKLTFADILERN